MGPLGAHPMLANVAFMKKKHFTLSERQILEQIGDRERSTRARLAALRQGRSSGLTRAH